MLNVYGVDDLKIIRDAGYDEWNEPLPVATEDVKGYIEWKTRLVRNFAGEEVVSRASVILVYDGTLDHKDKVRIDNIDYPIIALETMRDFSNIGLKVYLS